MKHFCILAALILSVSVSAAGCVSDAASKTAASAYEENIDMESVNIKNTDTADTESAINSTSGYTEENPVIDSMDAELKNEDAQIQKTVAPDKASSNSQAESEAQRISAFARQIKRAVAASDIESLAELCGYPVYVSSESGEGREIETRSDLVSLGADALFTQELKDTIAAVQESELETYAAGVLMGENGAIIFNDVNGNLVITGIHTGS